MRQHRFRPAPDRLEPRRLLDSSLAGDDAPPPDDGQLSQYATACGDDPAEFAPPAALSGIAACDPDSPDDPQPPDGMPGDPPPLPLPAPVPGPAGPGD